MNRHPACSLGIPTFTLIRPDKESLEPDQDKWFLWSIPITVAFCGLAVWLNLVWLLLVLGGAVLLLRLNGIPRKLLKDWPRTEDRIGELRADNDGLSLVRGHDVERVLLQDVAEVVFEHNHIMGRSMGGKDMAHNGIATLTMTLRDGKRRMIKFLVERKDQVPDVEMLLRTLYKRGVPVKEFAGRRRIRTVLFKHGRTFAELNALKQELGVERFY